MNLTYEEFKDIILADMGAFADENKPEINGHGIQEQPDEAYGFYNEATGYRFSSPKCPYAYTYSFSEDLNKRWTYSGARNAEGQGETLTAAQDDESRGYMKINFSLA